MAMKPVILGNDYHFYAPTVSVFAYNDLLSSK